MRAVLSFLMLAVAWVLTAAANAQTSTPTPNPSPRQYSTPPCDKPVYLTFDTGHMGVAPLVAEVLARQQVKATFFLANERTQPVGARPEGSTLDEHWAGWWKQLAAQGHDFGGMKMIIGGSALIAALRGSSRLIAGRACRSARGCD